MFARSQKAKLFINYRREDTAPYAGRLYDLLTAHFGKGQVFMDIDQIEPGEDFVEVINRKVGDCDIAIVSIGPNWFGVTDSSGRRRLDDSKDFVRMEIVAALKRKIRVIPVLVGGARMPREQDLPEILAPLSRRNAIDLSETRFHADVNRLIEAIEKPAVEGRAPTSAGGVKRIVSRQRLIITAWAAALFLVAVGFAGYFLWDKWTMLGGLDPALDYRRFRSSRMGLEFVYPQAHLTADTTQEDKGIIQLMSPERNVEALLRRTKLPEHSNVRVGRDIEEKKLRELGYSIHYLGPREEANWSNWYIVSGTKPDGTEYYYKRWYTNKDVVSIDFDYPNERVLLYNKIIADMMSKKHFRIH